VGKAIGHANRLLTASTSSTTFQSVESEFAIRSTPGRRLILPVAGMPNRTRSALSTFPGFDGRA
jgi:hypothetical protein